MFVLSIRARGRRRPRIVAAFLAAAATLVAVAADAGTRASCAPASVTSVAPGVYVRPGQHRVVFEAANVANAGFVVGEDCVAVVDTGGSEIEGQQLDCAIRQVTDRPVCFVINTHMHPDHILGNRAFKRPGVEFVGHAKFAEALGFVAATYLARAAEHEGRVLPDDYFVIPGRTVATELQLDLGERVLRVTAHPTAHTTNDLTVLDEQSGTLWAGDLVFLEHIPVLNGSVSGWLQVLDMLAAVKARRVVPGHGPAHARWPEAQEPTRGYLNTVRDEVRAWLKTGNDLRDAQSNIGYSEKPKWHLFEDYHRRNVASAFAELEWED